MEIVATSAVSELIASVTLRELSIMSLVRKGYYLVCNE